MSRYLESNFACSVDRKNFATAGKLTLIHPLLGEALTQQRVFCVFTPKGHPGTHQSDILTGAPVSRVVPLVSSHYSYFPVIATSML